MKAEQSDILITCKIQQGAIVARISYPQADSFTRYACYLTDRNKRTLQKQMYQKDPEFTFPVQPGLYYVRAFIRTRPKEDPDTVTIVRESKWVSVYPTVSLEYSELESLEFPRNKLMVYAIQWGGVPFEFAIYCPREAKEAVVLGTGNVRADTCLPIFSRITWAKEIPGCAIYYFDPTRYIEGGTLYWGYGTNQWWYLENVAVLLKRILDKLGISISNTLFFGSSGGGFTSVLLASMLHGRVTAINPQMIVQNYHSFAVRNLRTAVLKPGEELLIERTHAVKLFEREGFFPPLQIWQNSSEPRDITSQVVPFLQELSEYGLDWGDKLRIRFYYQEGGHAAMPPKEDCLKMMVEELARPEPTLSADSGPYPPGSLLARLEAGEF